MSSLNSFSLLEDTTGSDPVEIAKKRQQQKQAEAAKLAQQKKAEAAKATEEATKNAKAAKKGMSLSLFDDYWKTKKKTNSIFFRKL